jgi:CheY-like chemotaxis protein
MNLIEARHLPRPKLVRMLWVAGLLSLSVVASRADESKELVEAPPLVHRGLSGAEIRKELDIHVQKTTPPVIEPGPNPINALSWLLGVALIPGVILAWRKFGAFYREHFTPLETAPIAANAQPSVDDKLFSEFVAAFAAASGNSGSLVPANKSVTGSTGAGSGSSWVSASPGSLKASAVEKFYEIGPERLELIRARFSEVSHTADLAAEQKNLQPLPELVRSFVLACDSPELRPVLQLGRALEGLLRQMSENAANITPSTLRTAAGAIVLLETISKPGVRFEFAADPPARFLVVDDDPICRHAVSASLKKAFSTPDVAENGEAALKLATSKLYDVVFLDIEMPGMDGFEVCSRIHETELNRHTPAVFVTAHSDFASRTKSAEVGGHDLIGKPFLAFEIAVKALTFLLRHRLCRPTAGENQPSTASAQSPVAAPSDQKSETAVSDQAAAPDSQPPVPPAQPPDSTSQSAATPTVDEFARAFFAGVPDCVKLVRGHFCAVRESADDAFRQEKIGEIYVAIHTLLREAQNARLIVADRLLSTLLNLLKKFLEKPSSITLSALDTAGAALDLLEEFCGPELKQDLTSPPVRILLVDDDAVTRRALSGAVQVAFAKPDVALDGEAAVSLAQNKAFDMIFMDVRMPGMDGYAACAKIREIPLNRQTPVVFVTSSSDYQSRERAAEAGGCGFIPKPAMRMEVTLAALTFAFRGRLEKRRAKIQGSPIEELCTV